MYCSRGDIEQIIQQSIFPEGYTIDLEKIRNLQQQFKDLGHEVEEAEFAGMWYWFRVKCNIDEIPQYVEQLKNLLTLP